MNPLVLESETVPSGELLIRRVIPSKPWPLHVLSLEEVSFYSEPREGLPELVNDWRADNVREHFHRGVPKYEAALEHGLWALFGELWIRNFRADGSVENLGLASLRVVTTVGVDFIIDAFQNLKELENFKYHGIGTGTNAEAIGDTGLQTEITTGLNPDNTRATGTQTENAHNIYETVATNEVDSAVAVTEHSVFDQASTAGGTPLDRSVFAADNLGVGDRIETTYRFTVTPGS